MSRIPRTEPKLRETRVTVKGYTYTRYVVDHAFINGQRVRKTFKTRPAAERHIRVWKKKQEVEGEKQKILANRIGEKAKDLSTDDLLDAAKAVGLLKGAATLEEAAKFYLEHTMPDGPICDVDRLVEDYIASKIQARRRPDTIRDIRNTLGRSDDGENGARATGFAKTFEGVPVSSVSVTDLEKWLDGQKLTPAMRKRIRVHLVALFNYAEKRKLVTGNPAAPLDVPTVKKAKPYVLPVADVQRLMKHAASQGPEIVPYLALCLFAGIRPSETQRLTWDAIDFRRREIFVDSSISKTHDERWTEMSDNLIAWLLPYRLSTGPVFYSRRIFERVRKETGIRWRQDCMRHSFGSYHLAAFENAGKTALQMGHRELGTLFEYYRRAVRKNEADQYWSIVPSEEAKVIRMNASCSLHHA